MKFLTDKEFVTLFCRCSSTDELAKKAKLTKQAARARAMRLRAAGVKLPKYSRKKEFDLEELNAIVAKYTKKR